MPHDEAGDAVALTERLVDLAATVLHDADVAAPAAVTGPGITEVDVLLVDMVDGDGRGPGEDVLVAEQGGGYLPDLGPALVYYLDGLRLRLYRPASGFEVAER
ncbi:hypothetical protein DL769_008056 [Monosporascus sp. CRB-8-3]|nr:hypothetical protein DL769_008056 [Monosporascus sp. CRB-8-3]